MLKVSLKFLKILRDFRGSIQSCDLEQVKKISEDVRNLEENYDDNILTPTEISNETSRDK